MAKYTGYDFCGWATRNDIHCTDGRTIRQDAFKADDGKRVPLVWGHQHDSPDAVLGHGFLENCPEGVRIYGYFNNTSAFRTLQCYFISPNFLASLISSLSCSILASSADTI